MDWPTLAGFGGLVLANAYGSIQARRTHKAVQPNGESLADLLAKLIALTEYQHTRNHDLMNSLQRIEAKLPPPA